MTDSRQLRTHRLLPNQLLSDPCTTHHLKPSILSSPSEFPPTDGRNFAPIKVRSFDASTKHHTATNPKCGCERYEILELYPRESGRTRGQARERTVCRVRSQRLMGCIETTMSCPLPPEILDLIVDHLHNERAALKTCCLVSKSWVPRTRKHLFAHLIFGDGLDGHLKSDIELWKEAFPDPSNSPARHTHTLSVYSTSVVTAANAVDGWFHAFCNVVCLWLLCLDRASLIPFHGLSPSIKSLHLTSTTTNIFDLVCSFPLLEDLALVNLHSHGETEGWNNPSTSPKLTGSLDLKTPETARSVTRRLLDLPGGLHFSKINVTFSNDVAEWIPGLMSKCSGTLESITIACRPSSVFPPVLVTGQYLTSTYRRRHT